MIATNAYVVFWGHQFLSNNLRGVPIKVPIIGSACLGVVAGGYSIHCVKCTYLATGAMAPTALSNRAPLGQLSVFDTDRDPFTELYEISACICGMIA